MARGPLVIVFLSLRNAFKARDGARGADGADGAASLVFDFLRADIEAALPPTGQFAGTFTGTHAADDRGRDSDNALVLWAPCRAPCARRARATSRK